MELSEETLENIKKSREELKNYKLKTLDEVIKELNEWYYEIWRINN